MYHVTWLITIYINIIYRQNSHSNFTNASTMPSPLFQDGPYTTNSMLEQSSAMSAPYIQGGFTNLLLGVQQDAAVSSSARKLHFDENM